MNADPTPRLPAHGAPPHPLWLRATHWINALAVLIMVMSGWRIYNASPLFDFTFPADITLGGWLAGALQWHFAGMWLFALNGVLYLCLGLSSGRLARRLFPVTPRGVLNDARRALTGHLAHSDPSRYTQVQRAAYLFAILDLALVGLSGLVVWKSVQFPLLREFFGGYDAARQLHFYGMAAIVAFAAVHVVMAMLVPRSLLAMVSGGPRPRRPGKERTS